LDDDLLEVLPVEKKRGLETAPVLPSIPGEVSRLTRPPLAAEEEKQRSQKKFAKTLRLTSDQLVCPINFYLIHRVTIIFRKHLI
jgi:hypothetical protein